jgi:hypothetical protein
MLRVQQSLCEKINRVVPFRADGTPHMSHPARRKTLRGRTADRRRKSTSSQWLSIRSPKGRSWRTLSALASRTSPRRTLSIAGFRPPISCSSHIHYGRLYQGFFKLLDNCAHFSVQRNICSFRSRSNSSKNARSRSLLLLPYAMSCI